MKNKQVFTWIELLYPAPISRIETLRDDQARGGFTLIELLVVVLIIGILAAVALPQYQMAVTKSRLSTLKEMVESVVQAQERYYLANGSYTLDLDTLDLDWPTPQEITTPSETTKQYNYAWGYCRLSVENLHCGNSLADIIYERYYTHSVNAGKRLCGANTQTPISVQVCKQETGKTTDVYTGPSGEYASASFFTYD